MKAYPKCREAASFNRLPDAISRMHAATKAGSFGASLLLAAAALLFRQTSVVIECILIVGFFYCTAPIAAHLLGRVAVASYIPPTKK